MSSITKSPDRINITKKTKNIVDKIDQIKFLGLEVPTTTRSELFIFAMALGIETAPSKLENIHAGGFILDSSIDSRTRACLYGYFIGNMQNTDEADTLDNVTKKDYVYSKAQEYANTGFQILDDYLNNKKETELIWDLIKELDDQYHKNVK